MRRRERHALAAETRIQKCSQPQNTQVKEASHQIIAKKTLKHVERIWDFLSLRDLTHLNCAFSARKSVPSIFYCSKGASFTRKDGKKRSEVVYILNDDYILHRLTKNKHFGRFLAGLPYADAVMNTNIIRNYLKNPQKTDVYMNVHLHNDLDKGSIEIFLYNQIVMSKDIFRCRSTSIEYKMESYITLDKFIIIVNPNKDKHQICIQKNGKVEDPTIEKNGFVIRHKGDNPLHFVAQDGFICEVFIMELYKIINDNFNHLVKSVTTESKVEMTQ